MLQQFGMVNDEIIDVIPSNDKLFLSTHIKPNKQDPVVRILYVVAQLL